MRLDSSARNPPGAFSFEELRAVTSNFRQDSLIGGGGVGRVYTVVVAAAAAGDGDGAEPQPVAVKVHDGDNSFQGHREWLVSSTSIKNQSRCSRCGDRNPPLLVQAEVIFLGHLSHPNLVRLVGYCCEGDHRLLVYEYMPRGSVESHLFSRKSVAAAAPEN